jgi:serine/threonine-protein kinase
VALAAVLGLYVAPEYAQAQKDDKELAGKARDILQKYCGKCHGASATADLDVRDYKSLTALRDGETAKYKLISPKNLKESVLWERVGVTKDMPPKGDPPTEEDRKVLKAWIEAGAPDWNADATPKDKDKDKDKPKDPARPFIGTAEVLTAVLNDLREADRDDVKHLRYFTLNHLHNNPAFTDQQMRLARAALAKVLNSMHWRKPIVQPRQVDKYGTVYAIDLRDLDWDQQEINRRMETEDRWAVMMKFYFYGMAHSDPDNEKVKDLQEKIDDITRSGKIIMRGDWFVARATRPPVYEQVLRLPKNAYDLEHKLGVKVLDNFRRNRLARAGYKKSFVSAQNRMVERHDSLYGAFWKSYDFKPGVKKGNLMTRPLGPVSFQNNFGRKYPYTDVAFEQDGGEMIFNLPNGMQAYFLVNGKDEFIPKGPSDVVEDGKLKGSGTSEIINGLSCMVCHKDGMIDVPKDEVRNGTSLDSSEFMKKVRFIYVPNPAFNKLVARDRGQFHASLREAIQGYLSEEDRKKDAKAWPEPIYELVAKYYHEPLTLEVAAYELGYKDTADLKAAIKTNEELNKLGLRVLIKGGTISRDEWDYADKFDKIEKDSEDVGNSTFQRAASALKLGYPRR